jgi:hypothetical protein
MVYGMAAIVGAINGSVQALVLRSAARGLSAWIGFSVLALGIATVLQTFRWMFRSLFINAALDIAVIMVPALIMVPAVNRMRPR